MAKYDNYSGSGNDRVYGVVRQRSAVTERGILVQAIVGFGRAVRARNWLVSD